MVEVGIVRVADWPRPLREAWEAGIRPPLIAGDPRGAGALWRQQTIDTTAASFGRFLHFMLATGRYDPAVPFADMISVDVLRAYHAHLRQFNRVTTILHRMIGLERGTAVVAPKVDRTILRIVIANLEQDYDPISKRERLQEIAALVELGFSLMQNTRQSIEHCYRRQLVAYRDGWMIAFLAHRPVRMANLCAMEIDRHIYKEGGVWRLHFDADEVKNHKAIDTFIPDELVEPLEFYLDVIRPAIIADGYDGAAFWVSYRKGPMSEIGIRCQLCRLTEKAFGLPITPHLFRDCVATSLSVNAPDMIEFAHVILGNTYAVMEKHYNLARATDAARHVHATFAALRDG